MKLEEYELKTSLSTPTKVQFMNWVFSVFNRQTFMFSKVQFIKTQFIYLTLNSSELQNLVFLNKQFEKIVFDKSESIMVRLKNELS
jgi:hypothetical protein